jgi:magnesium transporter
MNAVATAPERDLLAVTLAQTLAREHIADIVETLNDQDEDTVAAVLLALPFDRAVEVLDQPELAAASEALALLPEARAAQFLSAMAADRVTDVVREFDEPLRLRMLGRVDHETRATLNRLLTYPEQSAGSIMTTEFVSVPADWTVSRTLDYVRHVERTRETIYAIYVLDPAAGTLLRAVSLRRLISAEPQALVVSAAPDRAPISVTPRYRPRGRGAPDLEIRPSRRAGRRWGRSCDRHRHGR